MEFEHKLLCQFSLAVAHRMPYISVISIFVGNVMQEGWDILILFMNRNLKYVPLQALAIFQCRYNQQPPDCTNNRSELSY